MIVLVHNDDTVVSIKKLLNNEPIVVKSSSVIETIFQLSNEYNDFIIWVHQREESNLNLSQLSTIFHHKKIVASFSENDYLKKEVGFVHDSSPNVNINKKVSYATWFITSTVGGIHSEIISKLDYFIYKKDSFNYFLHSIALLGMYNESLFCYSEPNLLKAKASIVINQASNYELFKFVKQHQHIKWTFFLLLNFIVHKREFLFFSFLFSFLSKKRKFECGVFDSVKVQSTLAIESVFDLDVIIPTIGRKNYLHNVLKDFSNQTLLPKKIIIVEQNQLQNSISELQYIYEESWPFEIVLIFTHQIGACNARNIALTKTTSNWVFLADDDNRFEPNLITKIFKNIKKFGCNSVTTSYLQKNEKQVLNKVLQWPTFGAGNSFVKRKYLKTMQFDLRLEFGYGEDTDFGMQLRNKGVDIIYLPDPNILHLKAPIGGFRTKPVLAWDSESMQPKPSPTIMLFALLHKTDEQIKGYKLRLFLKTYSEQKKLNPFSYFNNMKKQWKLSVYWANYLKNKFKE
ncbi:MAG: glycosyltransferase involved in cell wall biosynthesis [Flavobacterium sp.]|jgi:glycosyltransferase involved in cell wall biosynthesis